MAPDYPQIFGCSTQHRKLYHGTGNLEAVMQIYLLHVVQLYRYTRSWTGVVV